MAETTTASKPEAAEFEVPAEDAALTDLKAVPEEHREKLSVAQRLRISDADEVATARETEVTQRLAGEQQARQAESDADAVARNRDQTAINYHDDWRAKEFSAEEDDRTAFRTEMATEANYKRFIAGAAAKDRTIDDALLTETRRQVVLATITDWHDRLAAAGLGDLIPSPSDPTAWKAVAGESAGDLPKYVYEKGVEKGFADGDAQGYARAQAEIGTAGRPELSNAAGDGGKKLPSTEHLSASEMILSGMEQVRASQGGKLPLAPKSTEAPATALAATN